VVPQLSGVWQQNYSTKRRHAGCAIEESILSLYVYGTNKPFTLLRYLFWLDLNPKTCH
jgi:hypothetical protein